MREKKEVPPILGTPPHMLIDRCPPPPPPPPHWALFRGRFWMLRSKLWLAGEVGWPAAQGLGFRVEGLGLRVEGLGFRVHIKFFCEVKVGFVTELDLVPAKALYVKDARGGR